MNNVSITNTENLLLLENKELRLRLAEAEEALNAIRNGNVDAIIVSGSDGDKVFSLTSAETPYRVIIEEMEEGAVSISGEGIILYCNRRFSELVSIPLEQIIGSNFMQFIRMDEQQSFNRILKTALTGRGKGELVIRHGENPVYLHLSLSALPEGILGEVCIMVTDITELKMYQQQLETLVKERTTELEDANIQLKESNVTKDKLFAIIAHDLRNPFTTLLGVSDLLIENVGKYNTEKIVNLLSHINSASKSAYYLLENLLIWARSQKGQLQFSPNLINLKALIADLVHNLHSLAVLKKISLNYSIDEGIYVWADENMLLTILRNLITNAIKFSISGGEIDITAVSGEQEVQVTVSDTGIGVDDETKEKLFGLSSGTTKDGTAQEKGSGLGLVLCQEFVQKHGGKIWVESELNEGSKFTFTLPYNR